MLQDLEQSFTYYNLLQVLPTATHQALASSFGLSFYLAR